MYYFIQLICFRFYESKVCSKLEVVGVSYLQALKNGQSKLGKTNYFIKKTENRCSLYS